MAEAIVKSKVSAEKALAPTTTLKLFSLMSCYWTSLCVISLAFHLSDNFHSFIKVQLCHFYLWSFLTTTPSQTMSRIGCIILTVLRAAHTYLYLVHHIVFNYLCFYYPLRMPSKVQLLHLCNGTVWGEYTSSQIYGD